MKIRGLFVLMAAVIAMPLGCRKTAETGNLENLRIGFVPDPLAGLLYVARSRSLFQRRGLDVVFRGYEGGVYALKDMEKGELDAALCTEFAFMLQSFARQDLRAIATVSTTDNIRVIARKDKGILKPGDLKARQVGVSRGTNTEFLLGSFLALHGIQVRDVRIVDLKPSEIVAALSAGRIDAGCLYPPFLSASVVELGANGQSWSAQDGQDYFFLLVTTEEFIRRRPRVISAVLEALLEADSFQKKHNPEARTILARELGLSPGELGSRLATIRFQVTLNQDLLSLMEDEARWATARGLADASKLPNFFRSLHHETLERLKPEAVGLIH